MKPYRLENTVSVRNPEFYESEQYREIASRENDYSAFRDDPTWETSGDGSNIVYIGEEGARRKEALRRARQRDANQDEIPKFTNIAGKGDDWQVVEDIHKTTDDGNREHGDVAELFPGGGSFSYDAPEEKPDVGPYTKIAQQANEQRESFRQSVYDSLGGNPYNRNSDDALDAFAESGGQRDLFNQTFSGEIAYQDRNLMNHGQRVRWNDTVKANRANIVNWYDAQTKKQTDYVERMMGEFDKRQKRITDALIKDEKIRQSEITSQETEQEKRDYWGWKEWQKAQIAEREETQERANVTPKELEAAAVATQGLSDGYFRNEDGDQQNLTPEALAYKNVSLRRAGQPTLVSVKDEDGKDYIARMPDFNSQRSIINKIAEVSRLVQTNPFVGKKVQKELEARINSLPPEQVNSIKRLLDMQAGGAAGKPVDMEGSMSPSHGATDQPESQPVDKAGSTAPQGNQKVGNQKVGNQQVKGRQYRPTKQPSKAKAKNLPLSPAEKNRRAWKRRQQQRKNRLEKTAQQAK